MYDYDTPVSVQGYDPSLGAKEYRVISDAIKYIQPYTGAIYHMIIHQAVYMPQLDHHLMCPNQCRAHGVSVNDCPRIYVQDLHQESHAVVTIDEYGDDVIIPFSIKWCYLTFQY